MAVGTWHTFGPIKDNNDNEHKVRVSRGLRVFFLTRHFLIVQFCEAGWEMEQDISSSCLPDRWNGGKRFLLHSPLSCWRTETQVGGHFERLGLNWTLSFPKRVGRGVLPTNCPPMWWVVVGDITKIFPLISECQQQMLQKTGPLKGYAIFLRHPLLKCRLPREGSKLVSSIKR